MHTAVRPAHDDRLTIEHAERALADASRAVVHSLEELLRVPEPAASRWHRAGISRRGERLFNALSALLLVTFAAGWSWSIASARTTDDAEPAGVGPVTAALTTALTNPDAPTAAYLTDAALEALVPLRGESGRLRAAIRPAGEPVLQTGLPAGATLAVNGNGAPHAPATASVASTSGSAASAAAPAPARPGVWQLALRLGSSVQPVSFVAASSRAARLTASPIAV